MFDRKFWDSVLRDGAILGIVMALSRTFENWLIVSSTIKVSSAMTLLVLEMILVCVLFVWLLYRFAKRRSLSVDPRDGFPYGYALTYIFVVSVLTGILVGLANTLYIAVVGFSGYTNGLIDFVARFFDHLASLDTTGALRGTEEAVETLRESLESQPTPTVFQNILGSLNNYIISGTVVGLIVARIVRRNPEF